MKALSVLCSVLLSVALVRAAQTQILYTFESPNPEYNGVFGHWVSEAGDVNADGCADVVVGAYFEDGGAPDAGRAYVFSGSDGSLLHVLESPSPESGGYFGVSACGAGDLDGDGCGDLLVGACYESGGAPGAGRAYVFSGYDGSLMHVFQSPNPQAPGGFGVRVVGGVDVSNDGYPDVVVGAHEESGGAYRAGRVYVFSGFGGGLIYTLESPNAESDGYLGWALSAGDVNEDGYADVIAGARGEDAGAVDAGRAYAYGGNGGVHLYTLESPNAEAGGLLGICVSCVGDVNGDGCEDVIVGARGEDGGAADGGRAYVFSGDDGGLLYTLESPNAEPGGQLGYLVSDAGDLDGDGYADVLVGAQWEDAGTVDAGRAYVFRGVDGSLFCTLWSPNAEDGGRFGVRLSAAGDMNNDGSVELIVGAVGEDGGGTDAGRAYVFNGIEVPVELASFAGEPAENGVRVVWTTLSEKDNLGFNVERSPTQHGSFCCLNRRLIPGAGTTSIPNTYEYVDPTAESGRAYWYQLEDVSLAGVRTLHGPIQVVVPQPEALGLRVFGDSEPSFVMTFPASGLASLALYDVRARAVATVWEGESLVGTETLLRSDACSDLPPGLYAAVLSCDGATVSRRVVIAR